MAVMMPVSNKKGSISVTGVSVGVGEMVGLGVNVGLGSGVAVRVSMTISPSMPWEWGAKELSLQASRRRITSTNPALDGFINQMEWADGILMVAFIHRRYHHPQVSPPLWVGDRRILRNRCLYKRS